MGYMSSSVHFSVVVYLVAVYVHTYAHTNAMGLLIQGLLLVARKVIFTPRKLSLGQGNVFTGVCDSYNISLQILTGHEIK